MVPRLAGQMDLRLNDIPFPLELPDATGVQVTTLRLATLRPPTLLC